MRRKKAGGRGAGGQERRDTEPTETKALVLNRNDHSIGEGRGGGRHRGKRWEEGKQE